MPCTVSSYLYSEQIMMFRYRYCHRYFKGSPSHDFVYNFTDVLPRLHEKLMIETPGTQVSLKMSLKSICQKAKQQ